MMEVLKEHAPSMAAGGTAGIALTIIGYLVTSNFFVTPSQLESQLEKLQLEQIQELRDYVRVDDYRRDILDMKSDIKDIKKSLEDSTTGGLSR